MSSAVIGSANFGLAEILFKHHPCKIINLWNFSLLDLKENAILLIVMIVSFSWLFQGKQILRQFYFWHERIFVSVPKGKYSLSHSSRTSGKIFLSFWILHYTKRKLKQKKNLPSFSQQEDQALLLQIFNQFIDIKGDVRLILLLKCSLSKKVTLGFCSALLHPLSLPNPYPTHSFDGNTIFLLQLQFKKKKTVMKEK